MIQLVIISLIESDMEQYQITISWKYKVKVFAVKLC